jgi:tetratricopeptide (TPR) repeat protein
VHNALGDPRSARAAYEAAVARDGGNPYALNNLAYLLGRSGERMDYALQLAQNAGLIMPDSPEVQDTLIYITLRMGLKQQALEILQKLKQRAKNCKVEGNRHYNPGWQILCHLAGSGELGVCLRRKIDSYNQ